MFAHLRTRRISDYRSLITANVPGIQDMRGGLPMSVSQWGRVLVDEIEGADVPEDQMWIWPLGGPSLAVKSSGATVLIDPYTGSPQEGEWIRMVAVPWGPEDIRHVDAVFSTHSHDDHCHRETLLPLVDSTDTVFIGPAESIGKMHGFGLPADRITQAEDGQTFTFGNMTVNAEKVTDFSDPTALGWVLSVPGGPVLFDGGDALYGPEYTDIGSRYEVTAATLSVAGLLKTGEKIYMDAPDVVNAATDLGADLLIPKHWDLWRNVYMDPWEVVIALHVKREPIGIRIPRLGDVIKLGNGE